MIVMSGSAGDTAAGPRRRRSCRAKSSRRRRHHQRHKGRACTRHARPISQHNWCWRTAQPTSVATQDFAKSSTAPPSPKAQRAGMYDQSPSTTVVLGDRTAQTSVATQIGALDVRRLARCDGPYTPPPRFKFDPDLGALDVALFEAPGTVNAHLLQQKSLHRWLVGREPVTHGEVEDRALVVLCVALCRRHAA